MSATLIPSEGGLDAQRAADTAARLDRARWRIETLEEELADARADARAEAKRAKRAEGDADRRVKAAQAKAKTAPRGPRDGGAGDGVAINGHPRLAVNKTEAAGVLGVSVDFFDAHIAQELRVIRRGRRRMYAVAELKRWLEHESTSIG